eukprot:619917-Amphidinium_carterae.1
MFWGIWGVRNLTKQYEHAGRTFVLSTEYDGWRDNRASHKCKQTRTRESVHRELHDFDALQQQTHITGPTNSHIPPNVIDDVLTTELSSLVSRGGRLLRNT